MSHRPPAAAPDVAPWTVSEPTIRSSMCIHAAVAVAIGAVVLAGCERDGAREPPAGRSAPLFTEITAVVGIEDSPGEWPAGRYRIPELSPGGVALFDYDNDGDLDIYQVRHPPPDQPDAPARNRLFRQEAGVFREARDSGLGDAGYGTGVAIGDVDSDGDLDVYVMNVGPDALYRNDAGSFTDVTAAAGIQGGQWSSSGAFFDYDRDGDLDLYVSHYVADDPTRVCRLNLQERRDYCGPTRYQGVPDTLYRSDGDGTFTDATRSAGLGQARRGFGVVCVDLTGDGWIDIYVANDMQPNHLFVNRGDGTFVDEGLERAASLNGAGAVEASMGVAVGDVDRDGKLDLFMTHLVDQTNTLLVRGVGSGAGDDFFMDKSASSGLGGPSLKFTAWGCGLVDVDNDGDQDAAVVNGRVARGAASPAARVGTFWNEYAEPNQLFLNDGRGRFTDSSARGGEFTSRVEVTRALAFGDLDGDGDVDMVLTNVGNGMRVFRNDAPPEGAHWLRVRALTARRDALGALVTIEAGGTRQVQPVISAYSFQSASEPVAHFGLGAAATVEIIDVRWPGGRTERFPSVEADRLLTLREGKGESRP